jgi:hypothetical protein
LYPVNCFLKTIKTNLISILTNSINTLYIEYIIKFFKKDYYYII